MLGSMRMKHSKTKERSYPRDDDLHLSFNTLFHRQFNCCRCKFNAMISTLCPALLTAYFATTCLATATCYRQDNRTPADSTYTPCNTNQQFSMCYRTQPDSKGTPPDYTCLPNGITLVNNTLWGIQYWRQSCTDPTWLSPYCQNAFDNCSTVRN